MQTLVNSSLVSTCNCKMDYCYCCLLLRVLCNFCIHNWWVCIRLSPRLPWICCYCCCYYYYYYYGQQEEPAILISRLLLRTRRMPVCSRHLFRLPLRMNGMNRTQFDHARLDLLSLVIWSRVFWLSRTWSLRRAQRWNKSVLIFDRCPPHSVNFGYY